MTHGDPARPRAPWRVPPPRADHIVDWPADFGTRFLVTVDAEEEFDWSAPFSREARAVTAIAAMPGAAERFAGLGATLTALIDHPVATDPAAIDHLRRTVADHGMTIGAQLHPWVTPPFDEAVTPRNSFSGNLPVALEERKIAALTAAIAAAFAPPLIYRAGRYGAGPETMRLIARHGYRIDSSIRARYDYGAEGGPDFRAIGNAAFYPEGREGVVELPLTSVFTGALRRRGPVFYPAAGRVPLARAALARTGLLARIGLTPEEMPLADTLEALRVAVGEGERLLVLSFHSPSLVPGHTPYVRDAADLVAFWRWWDGVLAELARLGVRDVRPDAVLAALA